MSHDNCAEKTTSTAWKIFIKQNLYSVLIQQREIKNLYSVIFSWLYSVIFWNKPINIKKSIAPNSFSVCFLVPCKATYVPQNMISYKFVPLFPDYFHEYSFVPSIRMLNIPCSLKLSKVASRYRTWHNKLLFLLRHNLRVCHRMFQGDLPSHQIYIFHKYIGLRNIVHFECKQHFLSDSERIRTSGSISLKVNSTGKY